MPPRNWYTCLLKSGGGTSRRFEFGQGHQAQIFEHFEVGARAIWAATAGPLVSTGSTWPWIGGLRCLIFRILEHSGGSALISTGLKGSGLTPRGGLPDELPNINQNSRPRSLAIYHPPGNMGIKSDPFGKDIANVELFRALAHYGSYENIHVLTNQPVQASELETSLFKGLATPRITTSVVVAQEGPARTGALLRGQPSYIGTRLVATTYGGGSRLQLDRIDSHHCSSYVREQIAATAIAPVQSGMPRSAPHRLCVMQ